MKNTVTGLATRVGTFGAGLLSSYIAASPEVQASIESTMTILALVIFDLVNRRFVKGGQ